MKENCNPVTDIRTSPIVMTKNCGMSQSMWTSFGVVTRKFQAWTSCWNCERAWRHQRVWMENVNLQFRLVSVEWRRRKLISFNLVIRTLVFRYEYVISASRNTFIVTEFHSPTNGLLSDFHFDSLSLNNSYTWNRILWSCDVCYNRVVLRTS